MTLRAKVSLTIMRHLEHSSTRNTSLRVSQVVDQIQLVVINIISVDLGTRWVIIRASKGDGVYQLVLFSAIFYR